MWPFWWPEYEEFGTGKCLFVKELEPDGSSLASG